MRLTEEETNYSQQVPVVVFRFGGHHVHTNYYAVRPIELCKLGYGAEQAGNTASSAQPDIYTDGATAERRASTVEHYYYAAHDDWATDPDYHQGGRRNAGRATNTKYSGHNTAGDDSRNDTWDDAAGESERAQYAVRSGAGTTHSERLNLEHSKHEFDAGQHKFIAKFRRAGADAGHVSNDFWQRASRQPGADRSGDRSTCGSVSCGNGAERQHASAVV